jgi:hypothetical protein
MKREAEQGLGAPMLKRVSSMGTEATEIEEDDDPRHFFLSSQNKALGVDLLRCKQQIGESRQELEAMRNKSREMETLVGVIQRSWSQVCFV